MILTLDFNVLGWILDSYFVSVTGKVQERLFF